MKRPFQSLMRWSSLFSKRKVFAFAILVFIFTFAIRWFVLRDSQQKDLQQIKPIESLTQPEIEVKESVKITAIIEASPEKRIDNKQKTPKPKSKPITEDIRQNKSENIAAETIKVTKKHASEGLSLLKGERQVPLLELDFRRIGISRYLSMMKRIGARVFIGDARTKRVISEVILYIDRYQVSFIGFKEGNPNPKGFAVSTPHEIVDEEISKIVISSAYRTFGGYDIRLVVLLPWDSEAAFMGAIEEGIAKTGYKMKDFYRFSGEYSDRRGMCLFIRDGILKEGKRLALNLTLDITDLAGL